MLPFMSVPAPILLNPSQMYVNALAFVKLDGYGFASAFRTLVFVHFKLRLD